MTSVFNYVDVFIRIIQFIGFFASLQRRPGWLLSWSGGGRQWRRSKVEAEGRRFIHSGTFLCVSTPNAHATFLHFSFCLALTEWTNAHATVHRIVTRRRRRWSRSLPALSWEQHLVPHSKYPILLHTMVSDMTCTLFLLQVSAMQKPVSNRLAHILFFL